MGSSGQVRFSRRKELVGSNLDRVGRICLRLGGPAAIVIVMSMVMAMVSPSVGAFDLRASASVAEPDTFRVGFVQEPDSMNPFAGVLAASYWVYDHVYDLLVGIGPDLQPVPQLARSWSLAADNVNWTFDLYENVTWHDGQPFTADDVKFTIEYIQRCYLSLLLGYVGNRTADLVYIKEVRVISPTRVVLESNVPKANMLSLFVHMLPEHIWSQIACGDAETVPNEPPIGTGMYKFVRWQHGSFLELQLNEAYHFLPDARSRKAGMDFVERIFMQFYTDTLPLYNDFRAGDLDATDDLTARQFTELATNLDNDPEADVAKFTYDLVSISEIGFCVATDATIASFNTPDTPVPGQRHWLMTNLTIRQAIAMAINRTSLVEHAYQGYGVKGESIIPPATPTWHYDVPPAEEYSFDLEAAAALLNDPKGDGFTLEAGASEPGMLGEGLDPSAPNNADAFADTDEDGIREVLDATQVFDDVDQDGLPDAAPQGNAGIATSPDLLTFGIWIIDEATEQQTSADIFIPWLASIGISVDKVIVSEGFQIAVSYSANYDMYMWGFGGDVDPDFLLSVLTTNQILGWQDAWYSNPEYDALYLLQQTLVGTAERGAVVREMQRIAYRDQPYLVYQYPKGISAVRIDRFADWGNWSAQLGLGTSGFGNVFLMLQLEPLETPAGILGNPIFIGSIAAVVIIFAVVGVLVLRRSRKRDERLPPMPPAQPPVPPQGPREP